MRSGANVVAFSSRSIAVFQSRAFAGTGPVDGAAGTHAAQPAYAPLEWFTSIVRFVATAPRPATPSSAPPLTVPFRAIQLRVSPVEPAAGVTTATTSVPDATVKATLPGEPMTTPSAPFAELPSSGTMLRPSVVIVALSRSGGPRALFGIVAIGANRPSPSAST